MKKRLLLIIAAALLVFTACDSREAEVNLKADRIEDRAENEETPEVNVTAEKKEDGYVTVEVEWDESDVTFFSDSPLMELSLNDVCQPVLKIEGENVERQVITNGNIHSEKLTIKDPDEYINIFVEPCQPDNACPLDTAKATITYADGQTKALTADEMKKRGQTGIWYLDVYTQN